MKILAINTSEINAQIAICVEDKNYFKELDSSMKHSENLLPEIEKLLNESNIALKDLDAIAVNVGPGSFTGLRISIATVKAFLDVFRNIKCIKLTSFELLASKYYKNNNKNATFVLDALSGLYFVQKLNQELKSDCPPKMINKEELSNYENIVSNKFIDNAEVTLESFDVEILLELAKQKFRAQSFISESELLPLYIRPSQAEANRKV